MSLGSVSIAARRRTESLVGSVVVFDGDRIESRLGAAAGMLAMSDSFDDWSHKDSNYLQEMRGRRALLVDVGVDAALLQSMQSNEQEMVLVESSPAYVSIAKRAAGTRTRLVSGMKNSSSSMTWLTVGGGTSSVPDLMRGIDWMTVGEEADDRAVKLALGASKLGASVQELAAWLKQDACSGTSWEAEGCRELQRLLSYCEMQSRAGKTVSLGGAKVHLTESRRGVEGAVALRCQKESGYIGASWVKAGRWRELTLRGGKNLNLAGLCNAYGGYGVEGFGRISLSSEAFDALMKGHIGPIQAARLSQASPDKAARRLACVMRDDVCLTGNTLVMA